MTNHLHCEQCPVRDRAACSALTSNQRDELARIGQHKIYKAGDIVFLAGDKNDQIATLISGLLKVSAVDSDGVERIVSLIHPAGFVGELFTPSARFEVSAVTEARLCMFGRQRYENAVADLPELSLALLKRSIEEARNTRQFLGLLGRRSSAAKLAGLVLLLADSAGEAPCQPAKELEIPMSREEIAAFLGIRIETVSRQLKALENKEMISRKGNRKIMILDYEALTEYVE